MNNHRLRVAYFPDTFEEIDGVAHTSRQFEAYAVRRKLPFLVVHFGTTAAERCEGAARRITLERSARSWELDKHHSFDPLFLRCLAEVEAKVEAFAPDIVHITGPSDAGMLGMLIAHRLRIPLAASWHTNLHQYAEQRSAGWRSLLPAGIAGTMGDVLREASLFALMRFYGLGQVLLAPNVELCEMLQQGTRKPVHLMQRGVDTQLFSPARRKRSDEAFTVGYVGRLSPEKSVRELLELEQALRGAGIVKARFLIVGQGSEAAWLREHLQHAQLPGVLRGEALAEAFATMDVFAFPSRTDTFGNVVMEALASGVPAIVTDSGGPRYLVREGETGFITQDSDGMAERVLQLAQDAALRRRMSAAAREFALSSSWDSIFEQVYLAYEHGIREAAQQGKRVRARKRGVVLSQWS